MKVKIFSSTDWDQIEKFEQDINTFLKNHASASVQWLQSSCGGPSFSHTTLTAIVTYYEE